MRQDKITVVFTSKLLNYIQPVHTEMLLTIELHRILTFMHLDVLYNKHPVSKVVAEMLRFCFVFCRWRT
jgi:hypothetical protein